MSITPEQRQAWREDAETAQAFLNNYAIESDTHAATRILALLEALDAAERERDTWITRKRTADETADIVSAKVSELVYECEHLKDRAERAEAELDRHGPCICNTGPGTDGPDEFCPRHGRTYNDALDLAARHVAAAKAEALREAAEAVAADHHGTVTYRIDVED